MSEQDWWQHFDKGRPDDVTCLAFADWLEERGDPRAAAIRWIVRKNRQPGSSLQAYHLPIDGSWDWRNTPASRECYLPQAIFDRLPKPSSAKKTWGSCPWYREYPTCIEAFQALALAWTKASMPETIYVTDGAWLSGNNPANLPTLCHHDQAASV